MFGQSSAGGFGGFGNNNQQQQPAANAFGGGGGTGGGGFGQSATPAANTGAYIDPFNVCFMFIFSRVVSRDRA